VRIRWLAMSTALFVVPGAGAQTVDLTSTRIVDLTHSFNAKTLYWPTSPSTFRLDTLSYGVTSAGFFYSAFAFSSPEHGGTHLDAPIHFARSGLSADRIPLERLIAPAVAIDITDQAQRNADYRLTTTDVREFERRHGTIRPGSIVLLRTGWSRRWGDRKAYFGDDTPGDASRLHFPSFGVEAARLLIQERRVAALGIDAASIDYGPSTDFPVHQLAAAANVPALENLTNLHELPVVGAIVVALPIKIEGGSGGPARVVALVPR
jgi:kynurenine formamidase